MKKFFTKNTSKTKIAILIGLIIGIVLLITPFLINLSLFAKQHEIKSISQELSKDPSGELKPAKYYDESNIYDIMHKMANSKIIAKDGQVWGRLPMNKREIQTLEQAVEKIDYPDREYLLRVLNNWESGDFSNCVTEHNYVWNKLGGTIGEAYKLKNK